MKKPYALFDKIINDRGLKNDRALSLFLGVGPAVVSKSREAGRVSAELTIIIHKKTDMKISLIEKLSEKVAA